MLLLFFATRGEKFRLLPHIFLSTDAGELLGIVQAIWISYVCLSFSQSVNQVWRLKYLAYVDGGQRRCKIAKYTTQFDFRRYI